jgi:hypothetical protein
LPLGSVDLGLMGRVSWSVVATADGAIFDDYCAWRN